ncbi:MAG: dihydroorotase [Segatella oulorum]
MRLIIRGGTIINEGMSFLGDVLIEDQRITALYKAGETPRGIYDNTIDASGCLVMPGIIDTHVHFREPGFTQKGDIESESRAAAFGGVTSYMEMPNTQPQTTTLETWKSKMALAAEKSYINYSFFYGASSDNMASFSQIPRNAFPSIKLFMGASTGNMLVEGKDKLAAIFKTCADLNLPLVTHCEDTQLIAKNLAQEKAKQGDPDIRLHPIIRSEEACYQSTALAVALAKKYGTDLHVAHLTTARELEFFGHDKHITAEAVVAHLYFTDADYATLGARIKCNPAVKTEQDRQALRNALTDGRITTVGTDHAPHLLSEKQGGCVKAASGMPMIQFSLPLMLELAEQGVLPYERVVELMCHQPAQRFHLCKRGFLRPGYFADLTIVRKMPFQVTTQCIQSKCKWSPLQGHIFNHQVMTTICNGIIVLHDGQFNTSYRGAALQFET